MAMEIFLVAVCSYCLGSIPSGLLLGKSLWNIDLREHGSKNIGATNAYRTLGRWPAMLIFLADLAKGIIGVWLGNFLIGTPMAMILGGIMAIAGHSWSIFLGFKGGKGVATGLGVIAMLLPKVTLIVFGVWCIIVYFTRYVSLASVVGAALVPICTYFLVDDSEYLLFGLIAAIFVIYRHKTNIQRLLNGTETKIKAGESNK